MKTTILVDFQNLVYISFFGSCSADGVKPEECPPHYTNHVYLFHEKLVNIKSAVRWDMGFENPNVLFALDSFPKDKYALFPDYKKSRKDRKLQLDPKRAIIETTDTWDCSFVIAKHREADDVIASYAAQNFDTENIIVVTTDKDLWQLLDYPNTSIYNPVQKKFISKQDIEKAFRGISKCSQIKLYKTLWGDPSDNIPNALPRMQKQIIPVLKESTGALSDFKTRVKDYQLTPRCEELLHSNKDQLEVNYDLVRLKYNCRFDIYAEYPKD